MPNPPFLAVVPAIRTPFGVDVFDYHAPKTSSIDVGDIIRVPFRRKLVPALVTEKRTHSLFADKAIAIAEQPPIIKLGYRAVQLLRIMADHTFTSQPSVLHAWLRTVPQRASAVPIQPQKKTHDAARTPDTSIVMTVQRFAEILHAARQAHGRILIVTPWQQRADALARQLNTQALHAELAPGRAWQTWTTFVTSLDTILVTTRVGAWLASQADVVIIDEPENDDHKQDESAPRYDARWVIQTCQQLNPLLTTVQVSTTPILSKTSATAPTIDLPLTFEPWQRNSFSPIENISMSIYQRLEEETSRKRPIIIIHPIHGERSRVTCRDCNWMMTCAECRFPLTRERTHGRCLRCSAVQEIPQTCPSCGGSDLDKARGGKDRLERQVAQHLDVTHIRIADAGTWRSLTPKRGSLCVITDLSLIGGMTEDIRRRERLVIAWRGLAASIASIDGEIIAQGQDAFLSEARTWLTTDGVRKTWLEELEQRQAFRYPPAFQRVKLLVDGNEHAAQQLAHELTEALSTPWLIEGPFPVAYRTRSRKERFAIHACPGDNLTETDVIKNLEPFAKKAIIDLDPIAFFS